MLFEIMHPIIAYIRGVSGCIPVCLSFLSTSRIIALLHPVTAVTLFISDSSAQE
jgi:hypothetical protein